MLSSEGSSSSSLLREDLDIILRAGQRDVASCSGVDAMLRSGQYDFTPSAVAAMLHAGKYDFASSAVEAMLRAGKQQVEDEQLLSGAPALR